MKKLRETWDATVDELVNKVSWPTWDELKSSTIIVMIASLIFAIVIALIDVGFGEVMKFIYSSF